MKDFFKDIFFNFLKGFGVGGANVIPGVSGGTIALITGIFERLIHALKSLDFKAAKLLFRAKFKDFLEYTDLVFLLSVFAGILVSIVSFARILDYLFKEFPVYVWSYFFGLILASVFFVAKTISKVTFGVILTFIIGTGIAVFMSTLNPATENDSFIYLIICGVAAVSSMLLPGLSGSFVLMLMGNYELVMIDAVNHLNFKILTPFAIGVAIGLPLFSKALSWIYRKFKNQTISILSGFILGSLSILWPWKKPIFLTDANGINIEKPDGEPVISAYQRYLPDTFDREVILCIALLLIGILTIWLIQRLAGDPQKSAEPAVNDFFSI